MASWYTGHVIVPNGKLVNYVHISYACTYKKYIILRVEEGLITRDWTANSAQFAKFRNEQFSAFKKTQEYQEAFAQTKRESGNGEAMKANDIEEFLRQFYSERYMSMIFDKPR